ncbi:MAG: GIY-YIG nuclease family protein [Bacteroidales bacterium]|nr:GIY-YIG nuclease family protein [Bacteroidales bacterium]
MKPIGSHNYFVYILTNINKTVLYTGVTNDIRRRLWEHKKGVNNKSFTSKYKCFYIIFWERYQYIQDAIDREKEIKGWRREKKEDLINEFNPKWEFLNDEFEYDS